MRSRLGPSIESVCHINASNESSNFYIDAFFQSFWCVNVFERVFRVQKPFETTLWKAWRRRNRFTSPRIFKRCREAAFLFIWTRIWQKACKDHSVRRSALRCKVNIFKWFLVKKLWHRGWARKSPQILLEEANKF